MQVNWILQDFKSFDIIESFLSILSRYNDRFQLEIIINNFNTIESIIELALKNFQWPQHTVQIIVNYGLFLLQRVEYHPNKEQRE
ncbi:unnamed protein product [Rotaria sp. Silwood1]|nr:unnamed protein product [Rotaria sp. Silwood1]